MMVATPKDRDEDWAIDLLERIFARGPLMRWLINRDRRREGRAPIPWFEPRPRQ